MVFAYSVLLNCLYVSRWYGYHLLLGLVVWCKLTEILKYISRCDWLISFAKVSIYCWTIIWSLPFFLLFIQNVSLWILIFHIKVSDFLVDILKLQGNKFLKINKVIIKTFVITIVLPDINVLILIFGVPLISVSLFIWRFSLLISLIFSADFLFASDNSVFDFLIILFLIFLILFSKSFLLLNCFYFKYFLPLNADFLLLIDCLLLQSQLNVL